MRLIWQEAEDECGKVFSEGSLDNVRDLWPLVGGGLRTQYSACWVVKIVWFLDLSIGSTETKYIKLNTKTQSIFCCVNENLTTFLYTSTGGKR